MQTIVGWQFRAARAAVDITIKELSKKTGLAINTIRRAEGAEGVPVITPANMQLLVATYQAMGVTFLDANGDGTGVRWSHRTDQ